MDIYFICVVILTIVFSAAGIYFLILLRSVHKTVKNVDSTLERVRAAADRTEKVAGQAEESFETLNLQLPAILEDLAATAANVKSISDNAEIQLRRGTELTNDLPAPSFSTAASLGSYVLKGYSVWKRIKKHRLPL